MRQQNDLDFEQTEAVGRLRRQLIGFGALMLLVVMLIVLVGSTIRQADLRKAAEHQHLQTQEILITTGRLQSSIHAAGRSVRGFMITNDSRSLDLFERAHIDADRLLARLDILTADDPARHAEARRIGEQIVAVFSMGERLVALQRAGDLDGAIAPLRSGQTEQRLARILERIDALAVSAIAAQRRHVAVAIAADRQQEILTYSLAALALIFLGIAGMIGVGAARAHVRVVALSAQLHHIASHDELTGLLNRRSFFAALQREREACLRSGSSLAIAIVDIDWFKHINDGHGHQAGDLVLAHVAALLTDTLRAGDRVGRIGGEEFAVLMPATDIAAARTICERLRRIIARSSVPLPSGMEAMLTISTGIAVLEGDEDRDTLMGRADHALYAAKSGGRNQVRLAA